TVLSCVMVISSFTVTRSAELYTLCLHDALPICPYFGKGWYANNRPSIGIGKKAPVPSWLDYELWQGPVTRKPYKDNLVHYNWHWFWHYGQGELPGNGIHILDLLRWGKIGRASRRD